MKKNAIFLLTFLVCRFCYSQSGSTKSWTDMLSQATISLGKDSIVDFRESSGSIVKKRIFNIVGTGVIFYIKAIRGKDTIPAATVVTARHVFYSPQENHIPTILNIRFKWDEKKPLDKYFGIEVNLYDSKGVRFWIQHPDSTVDLACIPLSFDSALIGGHILPVIPYSMFSNFETGFEGEDVFALGFPATGIVDFGTKPVIRRGIISWISPLNPDKVPFIIDCNVFPGNSGGPIFANNSGFGKFGGLGLGGGFAFLGIVTKGLIQTNPVASKNHQIIYDEKGDGIFSTETFSLGIVEPAERVRELLDYAGKIVGQ